MRSPDAIHDSRWPGTLGAALGLIGLLVGLADHGRIARATDDPAPAVAAVLDDSIHLKSSSMGAVVIRPAATLRRLGSERVAPLVRSCTDQWTGRLAALLQVDPTRPGFRKVEAADIEAITLGLWMKQTRPNSGDPARPVGDGFAIGATGCVVRAVGATDWLAVLEEWGVEVRAIHGCHAPYYRLELPPLTGYEITLFAFLPDDRTLVIHDSEAWVKSIVTGAALEAPAFLRGADWRQANRGLAAVAVDNRNGQVLKILTGLFDGDGLVAGAAFMGVERWVASVADADEIGVSAEATTRSPLAAGMLGWGLGKLVDLARAEFKIEQMVDPAVARATVEANAAQSDGAPANPAATLDRLQTRMDQGAFARLQVAVDGPLVRVGSTGFGTFAEVGRMLLMAYADESSSKKAEHVLGAAPAQPDATRR